MSTATLMRRNGRFNDNESAKVQAWRLALAKRETKGCIVRKKEA